MSPNQRSLYWQSNEEWYRVNTEKDVFELTDKAPPEAVESFKLFNTKHDKNSMKY